MGKDHYVPKTYLRGFTPEYRRGRNGGELAVYRPGCKDGKKLSIKGYVACEPDFYGCHPLDKNWSTTIEDKWPGVRKGIKDGNIDTALLDNLFSFVSAQLLRTPSSMDRLARILNYENASVKEIEIEGRKSKALFMGYANTQDVLKHVEALWPEVRRDLEYSYQWTVLRATGTNAFLTSDNPCSMDSYGSILMPVALDLTLFGFRTASSAAPMGHITVARETVDDVNERIVGACDSFIYSHELSDDVGSFVVQHYRAKDIMESGRAFKNGATSLSEEEMIHMVKRFEDLRKNP
ncbi:DUF4238 domain-containing protein [Prosthecobacter sp.]|uniref:DUF4238 domain-containing protein n=1 Tax=Prosthecobacter sp. TaxID=1965333 RepID=UPI002ABA7A4A|nr:DUF4238 domain-containing protein [Prosthecobacter sp.]MDZ4403174.1 DUF4238 domain-containing protein [Prosthecobacter sp.]